MNFHIVHQLDEAQWRAFLDVNPHATIFHTPDMYQVFLHCEGYQPTLWAAVNPAHEIKALMVLTNVIVMKGNLGAWTARMIDYGGPVYEESEEGLSAFEYLFKRYIRSRPNVLYTEFRNLTDNPSLRPVLQRLKFTHESHINYWVKTNIPKETIWNNMESKARSAVRRAEKRGVEFFEMQNESLLDMFYHLTQITYNHKKTPIADISLFRQLYRELVPRGLARFFMGKAEDKYCGAYLMLIYKDTSYFWYSADDYEMRQYYTTDGFVWHILQWAADHNLRHMDFGWAGHADLPYGVRNFKAKFGGEEIRFGRDMYIHKPLRLKIGKLGYAIKQKWGL